MTFTAIFSACKKDDAPDNPKTSLTMISSKEGKKWKLTSWTATYTINGQEKELDILADREDCENDNITVLFSNNKYETWEGASKCDSSDDDIIAAGSWEFRKNDTQVVIMADGETHTMDIEDLNESVIKTEYAETIDGIEFTFHETYKAQ